MARYRILSPVALNLLEVTALNIQSQTTTEIVVNNSDGTVTTFSGTGLSVIAGVGQPGGVVTSITRTDSLGGATLEIFDQLNGATNDFAQYWNAPNSTVLFNYATSQGDTAFGSSGNDAISLGNSNDTFTGNAGDDTFVGGAGFDFTDYATEQVNGATQGVVVNLSTNAVTATVTGGTFTVAAGTAKDAFGFTDTLFSIEATNATNFDDVIIGSAADNSLRTYGGVDFVDGGAGFDEWQAVGPATGPIFTPNQAVAVSYTAGTSFNGTINNDGFGTTDTFASIERVLGSAFGDTFIGNDANNSFRGMNGADIINGGGGFDEVNYSQDATYGGAQGVIVNLSGATLANIAVTGGTFTVAANSAKDGFGGSDTLTNIENVTGTNVDDYIVGNTWDNSIAGLSGNDTLIGGDGYDFFTPGSGADIVDGSPGAHPDMSDDDKDTVNYNDGINGVGVIVNLSDAAITQTIGAGTFTVAATSARDWSGATDTLIDIERARGTNQADYLRGSDTNNFRQEQFDGLAGNDTIRRRRWASTGSATIPKHNTAALPVSTSTWILALPPTASAIPTR